MRGSVHAFRAQAREAVAGMEPRVGNAENAIRNLEQWALMAHSVLGGSFLRRLKWLFTGK